MVEKGTKKEGKEKGRRRQTTKKKENRGERPHFICECPRMFFVCFAILSYSGCFGTFFSFVSHNSFCM